MSNEHGDDIVELVSVIVLFVCLSILGLLAGWALWRVAV